MFLITRRRYPNTGLEGKYDILDISSFVNKFEI